MRFENMKGYMTALGDYFEGRGGSPANAYTLARHAQEMSQAVHGALEARRARLETERKLKRKKRAAL